MNQAIPCACARCGAALEPDEAAGRSPALLADLCLDCLEAVWDAVMVELRSRRRAATI